MTTEATPATEFVDTPPTSVWEDYVDIFYAPRDVFARRLENRWILGLFVVTVIGAILTFGVTQLYAPIYESMVLDAVRENAPAGATAEEMAQMQRFGVISAFIGAAVGSPLMIIVLGFGIWLVGRIFGSVEPLSGALLIAVYSQFPRLVQSVAMIVQGLMIDVDRADGLMDVALSPARFIGGDGTEILPAILDRFNPFTLWCTALIAIGLIVKGRLGRTQGILAAGLLWILALFPIVLAGLQGG